MKPILTSLVTIFSLLLINVSCYHDKNDIHKELALADYYITRQPKISLQILDSINNIPIKKDYYFALLYSQAQYRNAIKISNDSLIKIALQHYSTCSDSTMKARTFLVAAQIYRKLEYNDIALNYIHKAAATNTDDNWITSNIYYIWGILLRDAGDINSSIEKIELSLAYAQKGQDTTLIISRMRELGYNYLAHNNYDQSLSYINRAIELSQKSKSFADLSMLYGRKAQLFRFLGNFTEALNNINNALLYNEHNNKKGQLSNLNYKGRLLLMSGAIDSVEYYLEQGKDTTALGSYYECMSLLREKQGDYKAALEYSKLCSRYLLKLASKIENDKIARLDKQYNTARVEAENKALKIRQQQNWLYMLALIIAVGIIAFTAYAIFAHRRKKMLEIMRQQSENINRLQQSESLLMDKQIKASEKSMELLHNLDDREKELEITKNTLNDLKKRLFFSNRIVRKIQETIDTASKPKHDRKAQPLNDEEIAELIDAINNCYDNFTDKLRSLFPSLATNDVYLCCLVKIGLDNPALSAMLDISDNTLRKRKYRLKKEKIDPDQRYSTLEDAIHGI